MLKQSLASLQHIPRPIWVLGFVSLLTDISSEMIHSLLPLFMVTSLGMSVTLVGLIEGIAEATALMVKIFSGALSDYMGRRKPLALVGYGLSAVVKPIFAIASSSYWILGARVLDRVGKGVRGAPRDALVADCAPAHLRGAAFGLRQSLDTVGAFLGPLLAVVLMWYWSDDFRAVFWVATIPAIAAVFLLWRGVKEPPSTVNTRRENPLKAANLKQLPRAFWWVVVIGGVFTLSRFSEAFLLLRAQQSGIAIMWLPLFMVAMNMVYALSAYPFGHLSDRVAHSSLLLLGIGLLLGADLVLAYSSSLPFLITGVLLWGLHMGMTQGLLAAMVAATAPAHLRGTAFGFFNLFSGIAMLLASVLAGLVWDGFGAEATFLLGAAWCALTLILLIFSAGRISDESVNRKP